MRLSRSCTSHFCCNARRRIAPPSAPARCGHRSLQSTHANAKRRRKASRGVHVHAQRFESGTAARCEITGRVGLRDGEPAQRAEAIVDFHAERTGEVVVTCSCGAQRVRRVDPNTWPNVASEQAQGLEGRGNLRTLQAVVAMLPLREDLHETQRLEPQQVHAGRRRRDVRENRELGARAGTTVHEAVQHPRARGLADRRGDGSDGRVRILHIHDLMVNESSVSGNCHTANHHDSDVCDPVSN